MTFAGDLIQLNPTPEVKSIAHIFKVSPKVQLFGAPKNRGVITWCTHDFFRSRWASPLDQPSLVVGSPFYAELADSVFPSTALTAINEDMLQLWHSRLGHLDKPNVLLRAIIVPYILSDFWIIGISHLTLSCLVKNLMHWRPSSFFNNAIKGEISVCTCFAPIMGVSIVLISLKSIEISAELYGSQ